MKSTKRGLSPIRLKANVPLATVTKKLADKINETALPQDIVTEGILRDKVRQHEGKRPIRGKPPNTKEQTQTLDITQQVASKIGTIRGRGDIPKFMEKYLKNAAKVA